MKRLFKIFCTILLLSTTHSAFALTFTIGVTEFYPPYVMKSATNNVYGFDVSIMHHLCRKLSVKCVFKQMPFNQLLPAVIDGELDLAISSIVITKDRLKKVHFSMPYVESYGRFIHKSTDSTKTITDNILEKKRIGIQKGTAYVEFFTSLKLTKPDVTYYRDENDQVAALMADKIDLVLTDNQAALWWLLNSSELAAIDRPFVIGKGLGIAVAEKNIKYLDQINRAIIELKKSNEFELIYKRYFTD